MFKLVLLLLTLSGLQAAPVVAPKGLRRSTHRLPNGFQHGTRLAVATGFIPDDFRQGTEPSRRFIVDLNTGLVQEHLSEMERRVVPADVPVQRIGGGWLRVAERSIYGLPEGFRQGTERSFGIPEGFRQGTERSFEIPEGFRQGTEHSQIPEGFRQGTEHSQIPEGFRQGTERSFGMPEGFRQGTDRSFGLPEGFRQGTERSQIPEGFRQGTEQSSIKTACLGEIINGICYEFQPTPLAFPDAQARCRASAPNAELASVSSGDLHSRLVSLVTKGGQNSPVLTWLGATVKRQQGSWVDGSEWSYSDWMPGHPNIHTDKPVCVEMFKIDESWWTAADCDLKRASICAYPVTA